MSFNSLRFTQYLLFVEERHRVWERRQRGVAGPWTEDPILASKKFTNVFRVIDPGSQFILTDLVEPGLSERDMLMRLFLYRHTGRVEAWRHLEADLVFYPTVRDLDRVLQSWHEYRGEFATSIRGQDSNPKAGRAGAVKRVSARPIFTGAYLVFPQSQVPGTDKLESIVRLTQRLFSPDSPEDVVPDFLAATTQADRFKALRRNRGVADFMSMQILTDWGYTPYGANLENEFVVPGPGARRGVSAITDTPHQVNFMHFARAELLMSDACPYLNLDDQGTVRYPSIMDVQNTMCEFSKYVRYLDSGKAFQPYQPAHPGRQEQPLLPSHWDTSTR